MSFWSTLGFLGGTFGSLLGIFSGMGVKVKTVLSPAREFDFQGLGGSESVVFRALCEHRFERFWNDLGRFGSPFRHPFREKLGPF